MLIWTSRMRWSGTRSAHINMLSLSRPRVIKRSTKIIGLRDSVLLYVSSLSPFASISSLIGLAIIIFVLSRSCLCVLSISYSILLYFGLLLVSSGLHFLFGINPFCYPSTLTYTYAPTSDPLLFRPSPPQVPICLRLLFLDAVSRHMSLSFLP
ncbi:uncharacterized protein EDB91DRAFT_608984 [Suillus paluster]|uniref:uncharacterized protein n=1 Tax=Suillus paluster TaxID=48578 RepID=UPI001B884DA8|nr:uncharacterized protein EDB91DRAFT_608984 [Suillus paluster]KAG1751452.1 hypothetical protein EDB91DRAFT_608984 [Suillus paluster]